MVGRSCFCFGRNLVVFNSINNLLHDCVIALWTNSAAPPQHTILDTCAVVQLEYMNFENLENFENLVLLQLEHMNFVNFANLQLVHMSFVEIFLASQPRLHP